VLGKLKLLGILLATFSLHTEFACFTYAGTSRTHTEVFEDTAQGRPRRRLILTPSACPSIFPRFFQRGFDCRERQHQR